MPRHPQTTEGFTVTHFLCRGVSLLGLMSGRVQVEEEAREKHQCIGICFWVVELRGVVVW